MKPAIGELFSVRRVLVPLDPARPSAGLLEAAVEFARRVEAELEGLFIEDVDLMRLAELPFTRALSLPAGLPQALDSASMERDMRALAGAARRALELQAGKMNVSCSFRVVRGRLESEVAAAGAADLVILDRAGAAVTRYVFLGQGTRMALGASRSVLLLRECRMAVAAVVVAYDGSPASERALAAAASLGRRLRAAGAAAAEPIVLCLGKTRAGAERALKHARRAAARAKIAASFRTLAGGPDELAAALNPPQDTLLILPAELPLLAPEAGERLLGESQGPILLVR